MRLKKDIKRRNKKRITNARHSELSKPLRWLHLLTQDKREMNVKKCLNSGKANVRLKLKS